MMNKSLLVGVVVGVGIATAGAVVAYAMRDNGAQEVAAQTAMTQSEPVLEESAGEVSEFPVTETQESVVQTQSPAAEATPAVQTTAPVSATPATAPQPAKKKAPANKPAPAGVQTAAAPAAAPAQRCWDEEVTHTAEPKDDKRIAGTAIGAVVGGVIGNQFGGGKGKKLATVAGAAGGAYAGNRAEKAVQDKNTYTTIEHRCEPVQ